MLTTRAKRAIIRRIFLIGGTVCGITFALWQRGELYRVNVEDFARRQQNEYAWTGRRQMTLQEYIDYRTEEHLVHKSGQAWIDLYREAAEHDDYCFFRTNHSPLNELADDLKDQYSFTYVALEHEGGTVYLCVSLSVPGESPAPASDMRYPMRYLALPVFLAGLLGYILIPWPKRNVNTVAYTRFIGALLPDIGLGMLFVGVFFTLPWLIVPTEAGRSHPLVCDGGWIILTLIMWGFCLFGLAIHIVAAWYEAICIHVGEDHLVIESLIGSEHLPFADIEKLTFGVKEPPRALVKAGMLVSMLNWRAAGPTLLVASQDNPVVCIIKRDGRGRSFGLKAIYHLDTLVMAMKKAGIPVDPQLESVEE